MHNIFMHICTYIRTYDNLSCFNVFTGPPPLTVNIMKNIENSSIVVQWDAVDDFLTTTYTVTWTSERDHNLQVATLKEQSSYTITGLTLDTVYSITVTAVNKCGAGPEVVNEVSFSTDTTSSIFSISAISSTIAASVMNHSTVTTNSIDSIPGRNTGIIDATTNTVSLTNLNTTIAIAVTTLVTTTVTTSAVKSSIVTATTAIIMASNSTSTAVITNPITATNIVVSSTSTAVNPVNSTTDDKSSKFLVPV